MESNKAESMEKKTLNAVPYRFMIETYFEKKQKEYVLPGTTGAYNSGENAAFTRQGPQVQFQSSPLLFFQRTSDL